MATVLRRAASGLLFVDGLSIGNGFDLKTLFDTDLSLSSFDIVRIETFVDEARRWAFAIAMNSAFISINFLSLNVLNFSLSEILRRSNSLSKLLLDGVSTVLRGSE